MCSTRLHVSVQAQRKEHLLATEDLARDLTSRYISTCESVTLDFVKGKIMHCLWWGCIDIRRPVGFC